MWVVNVSPKSGWRDRRYIKKDNSVLFIRSTKEEDLFNLKLKFKTPNLKFRIYSTSYRPVSFVIITERV